MKSSVVPRDGKMELGVDERIGVAQKIFKVVILMYLML
jgi:hypothetical protein